MSNYESAYFFVPTTRPSAYEDEDTLTVDHETSWEGGAVTRHVTEHLFGWDDVYEAGVQDGLISEVEFALGQMGEIDSEQADALIQRLTEVDSAEALYEAVTRLPEVCPGLPGDWSAVADHGLLTGLTWRPREAYGSFQGLKPEGDNYDWDSSGYKVEVSSIGIKVTAR